MKGVKKADEIKRPLSFATGEKREAFSALIRLLQNGDCTPEELTKYILSQKQSQEQSEETEIPASRTFHFGSDYRTKERAFTHFEHMPRMAKPKVNYFNWTVFFFFLFMTIFILRNFIFR